MELRPTDTGSRLFVFDLTEDQRAIVRSAADNGRIVRITINNSNNGTGWEKHFNFGYRKSDGTDEYFPHQITTMEVQANSVFAGSSECKAAGPPTVKEVLSAIADGRFGVDPRADCNNQRPSGFCKVKCTLSVKEE